MGILEAFKDVRYRIRIFDNDNFLMSAEVPDKGQRYITVTVHKSMFGLGEKVKLTFMLNPKIKPRMFQGKIMEVDFDIRDSTQLGDIIDADPNLVKELNKNFDQIINDINQVQEADFTVQGIEEELEKGNISEEEAEDYRTIDTIIRATKNTGKALKDIAPHAPIFNKVVKIEEDKKAANVKKCLILCKKHPKLLYWLPKHLDVEPEVSAIVSQSCIAHVGIEPAYYHAQSGALIAEKVLARPSMKTGWEQVVLLAVVAISVVAIIALVLLFISGRL